MQKQKQLQLIPAVLATGIMSFAGVLIETAMNVTFPTLIQEFQISTSQVQWVTTIYLLMIAIIVPLSTYLTKNFSLRTLFLSSNLLFIAGLLVDYFSPTLLVTTFRSGTPRCCDRDSLATDVSYHLDFCSYGKKRNDDGSWYFDNRHCTSDWSNVWWDLNC